MNQFLTTVKNSPWVWPVTGMFAVTGLLLGGALRAQQTIEAQGLRSTRQPEIVRQIRTQSETIRELNDEIRRLRSEKFEFQDSMNEGNKQVKVLKDALQDLQLEAGITAVKGPGVEIVLRDSKKKTSPDPLIAEQYIIHDFDILRVVNELFTSGAEAISVNGHRLVGGYSIRCAGPIVNVNNVQIGQPYVIQAIGDPSTLEQAVHMNGGVLADIISVDQNMVQVTRKNEIILNGFEGGMRTKHAKPVKLDDEGKNKR